MIKFLDTHDLYVQRVNQEGDNFHLAVAMFPIRVVNVAMSLRDLIESKRWAAPHPSHDEMVKYLSEKIQDEYRALFGVPMGGGCEQKEDAAGDGG
jgi:hypothetical protein